MTLLLLLGLISFQNEPVMLSQENQCLLRLDSTFLDEKSVLKSLKSGLTTTIEFQIIVNLTNGKTLQGGSKIFIRYELWDEKYLVEWVDSMGHHHSDFSTLNEIKTWFADQNFSMFSFHEKSTIKHALVLLKVLPFSQHEQQQAKKWMSRTISSQQNKPGNNQSNRQVMDMIIGTSVKRPSLVDFSWDLDHPKWGS